jgi:hypothetical protein
MNFSNPIKCNYIKIDKNNNNLAIIKNNYKEIDIYSIENFKKITSFQFKEIIDKIKFSYLNNLILILFKNNNLEIKNIFDPTFNCQIIDNIVPISNIKFSPDSNKIIIVDEFNLKINIYNLENKKVYYIQNPKFHNKNFIKFSNSKLICIIPEKYQIKEYLGIYLLKDFNLINYFQLNNKIEIKEYYFLNDDSKIVILNQINYNFFIINLLGEIISEIEIDNNILDNINNFKLSFNKNFICLSMLNNIILYDIFYYNKIENLKNLDFNQKTLFFEEIIENKKNENSKTYKLIQIPKFPYQIKTNKKIKNILFSYDSNYLAYLDENYPNCLFIYNIPLLYYFSVIILSKEIKDFKWSIFNNYLYIISGLSKIYVFNIKKNFKCIDISSNIQIENMKISKNGKNFILSDKKKTQFVIGFLN